MKFIDEARITVEAGNGGSYPVIYNAIMDALDGNGGKEIGIPTTPPKVWKALNAG